MHYSILEDIAFECNGSWLMGLVSSLKLTASMDLDVWLIK